MNDFFSDFKFVLPDLDDVREFLGKCLDKFAQWFDFDRIESVLRYDSNNPLLFNTGLFLLLFMAFLLLYRLLRFSPTLKKIFVILFSLYFYYKSSAECCFILLGVCISDYVLGLILGNSHRKSVRTGIVTLNVVINVGMLVYFKYFNLLYSTIANFSSRDFDALDIILPAGISFFTFRSISYIVDIYRGDMKPATNFLNYVFFLTFFPPILAGPVVRARDMMDQIEESPVATRRMVSAGLFMIMAGLIKKVIVADYISGNFVDRVFDNPSMYSGFENLMGIYGFTIQLYCDFSGYSDMAIGIALLLGYKLKMNFDAPFKSQSPTEYWRRWHISLSSWLRDYLYIPMGGNRCSKARAHMNVFNTMLIGGLWHGASWMYVIWGAWNGGLLVAHKMIRSVTPRVKEENRRKWWRVATNVFITFNLIAVGMMFFRARSLEQVGDMVHQIVYNFHLSVAPQFLEGYILIVLAMALGYFMHFSPKKWSEQLEEKYHAQSGLVQAVVLALVLLLIIQVRQSDIVPFIYLQY